MKRLIKAVLRVFLTAAALFAVHTYAVGIFPMHGNNMYPSIRDGDLCIIYRLGEIGQSDVVIYEYNGEQRIGRVAAVEGSTVTMSDEGSFMIDGYAPAEEVFYPTFPGALGDSIEVGEGEWMIMNDLRTEYGDSRDIGCIKTSDIKGKVLFLFRGRGI